MSSRAIPNHFVWDAFNQKLFEGEKQEKRIRGNYKRIREQKKILLSSYFSSYFPLSFCRVMACRLQQRASRGVCTCPACTTAKEASLYVLLYVQTCLRRPSYRNCKTAKREPIKFRYFLALPGLAVWLLFVSQTAKLDYVPSLVHNPHKISQYKLYTRKLLD